MKKLIFSIVTLSAIIIFNPLQADAQHHGHGKHWEKQNKYAKKQAEFYRKQDKKRAEYYRKIAKNERKYHKEAAKRSRKYWKEVRKHGLPGWARHHHYAARYPVYFPDYETYYDPYRGGYVYRSNQRWIFSQNRPSFLLNINLGIARIRLLTDIPLKINQENHGDDYYEDYYEDYEDYDEWDD